MTIARTTVLAALSLVSTAALADGATSSTTVDDYSCFEAEGRFGDTIERCGEYDGVLHITELPSEGEIGIFNGYRAETISIDGELLSSQEEEGHLVVVDSDGDGEWEVQRNDLCRSFTDRFGRERNVDTELLVVDGALVYRSVEEVESCD